MESSWIASQKKAFARWANHVLGQRGLAINDIDHDLRTGSILISLIEILSGDIASPRKTASTSASGGLNVESKIQSFTTATRALKFIEAQGINLVNCRPEHLVDNNSKMVLVLLWRIITHYHIQPLMASEEEMVPDLSDSSGSIGRLENSKSLRIKSFANKSQRDAILRWCKTEMDPYNITPSNLTKSFQSPSTFAALVHKLNPNLIDMEEINNMEPAAAFAKIFSVAETQLEIPQILDPSDLLDAGGADECCVMTYLAYFVKRTPAASKLVIRARSQNELSNYHTRIADTRDETSEEMMAENAKLRAENRHLKEFIKIELGKISTTMTQNMQRTSDIVEQKVATLSSKTIQVKQSLESYAASAAASSAESIKLRQEVATLRSEQKDLGEDVSARNAEELRVLKDEVEKLRAELAKMEALRTEASKIPQLNEEVAKLETKNNELNRNTEELQRENQELQRQLSRIPIKQESTISLAKGGDDTATNTNMEDESIQVQTDDASDTSSQDGDTFEQESAAKPEIIVIEEPTSSPAGAEVIPIQPTPSKIVNMRKIRNSLTGEQLRLHRIIVVQSVVRRWSAKRRAKRARRRQIIATEIINTEKTYVASLQTLLSEYFQPLRKMAAEGQPLSHTLNENLLKTIFNNAEVIFNINSNLLAKLEQRYKTWNFDQKIGDVFLSTMEFLKCYNQYVNHYNRSLDTLAECAKITAFMDFLKRKSIKCGSHLRDLLIVPVQRIPRYVILLEEMVRYTDASHTDFKELTLALSKMHRIADYVNEKKRDFEALAQVSAIQETLVGISILEYPRLRFLLEGELVSEGGKKSKQYHVFLFNEIVLLTKLVKKVFGDRKQKQLKYKFLELIKLSPESKVHKNDLGTFSIEVPNIPAKKFTTTTEKDRDQWVQHIQTSIDKMIEAKRTKAVDRM